MPDVDDLTPGQVLADASVAEFIKSLGLSIAEAQKALDDNSVNQIGEFITPRDSLGGKTLLEMGLSPAFYHYQHADITCSMQLSLRIEKNTGVGVNLSGSFNDTSTESGNQSESSQSSESGSSTRTERTATVEVQSSASAGTLTIGGQNFTMSGDDPLARIRALQEAVTANDQAGVGRLLYEHGDRSFTITENSDSPNVETTDRTVSFLGGGFDSAIIQMDSDTNTDYIFSGAVTVNTTSQGSLSAYSAHVQAQVDAAGYDTYLMHATRPFGIVNFKTGKHHFEVFDLGGTTYNANSMRNTMIVAQFAKAKNLRLKVKGYADAQPYRGQSPSNSDASNVRLGQRRADEVKRLLVANGMDPGMITTESDGSTAAQADVANNGGPRDNVEFRKAEIVPDNAVHYLLCDAPNGSLTIETGTPDKTGGGDTGNGFAYKFRPTSLGLSGNGVTIDGTSFNYSGAAGGGHSSGSPEAHAFNLKNSINGNSSVDFEASAEGNVVTVFGKSVPFRLNMFTSESRNIQISSTEGFTVTEQFSRSQSSNLTQANTGNRTVAVGASVDVRVSRQFEMNVTGNSSISARLVSIPAPPQFLETIQDFLNPSSGDSDG
ncbi:MAG: OmpA family protein [Pseudomonadota bacterium]